MSGRGHQGAPPPGGRLAVDAWFRGGEVGREETEMFDVQFIHLKVPASPK